MFIICSFFSVSALIVFQSWFLRDGNEVFFSDVILFIISTFIFSSCVSLCSVVFGCEVFRLILLCVSIRLEGSCFLVFSVSILVLRSCWHYSLFICWCISNIPRPENQSFFIIVVTWSASCYHLGHSSEISIFFLILSLCRVTPTITGDTTKVFQARVVRNYKIVYNCFYEVLNRTGLEVKGRIKDHLRVDQWYMMYIL